MSRRCTAHNRAGNQCKRWAVPGALICNLHGGAAPQVKAKATVVTELARWGLGDTTVDPGETLLRLLSQAVWRAERYGAEIAKMVDQQGLEQALVGESWVMSDSGSLQKVGEYVRGLASLENTERDRAAKYAKLAIDAGLAERQVRLAERQGALIEQVLTSVFDDLGLSEQQRSLAPAAIRRALGA